MHANAFLVNDRLFLLERPDFNDAIIMRRGASVEHVVSKTHMNSHTYCRYQDQHLYINNNRIHTVYVCRFSLYLQCHRIHRTLASQFKYALVWVSKVKSSKAVTFRNLTYCNSLNSFSHADILRRINNDSLLMSWIGVFIHTVTAVPFNCGLSARGVMYF